MAGRPTAAPALAARGLSMAFGGQQVLHAASLTVDAGEVHALVGHNGSGKSTLVKILAGVYTPLPSAEIAVGGRTIAAGDPQASYAAGLRFVHQDLGLVDTLDVVDNVLFGTSYPLRRGGRIDWSAARRAVSEILEQLGYRVNVRAPVARLSVADRTGVALARALYAPRGRASLVVLDETTAALAAAGVDHLFDAVRRLTDLGLGVLYISHRLDEVFAIADRTTVLRDGRVVAVERVGDLDEDRLIELIVGRGLDRPAAARAPEATRPAALTVRGLSAGGVRRADFDLGAGEILGIAGLDGSGRDSVAPALFGAIPRRGVVRVGGRPVAAGRPDLAIRAGIGLLPADRLRNGLFGRLSGAANLTVSDLPTRVRFGPLDRSRERAIATDWFERLDVRPRDPALPVQSLSGGNQQKVLLGRSLRLDPDVLLLDEPTQGVDVGAVDRIHALLRAAAADGAGVLVCSSDSNELARLCDRVLVFTNGVIRAELVGAELSVHAIDAAALSTSEGIAS